MKLTNYISTNKSDKSRIFYIILSLTIFFSIDIAISQVTDFLHPQLISAGGIVFFAVIATVFIIGVISIMKFIKINSQKISAKVSFLNSLHKSVGIVEYILFANILVVIFSIVITSSYFKGSLYFATILTQAATVVIYSLFSYKFLSWYRSNKNSILVVLYGLAFAILAFDLAFVTVYDYEIMKEKQDMITPQTPVEYADLPEGSYLDTFFNIYAYIDMIAFLLLLAGTALLLRHYARSFRNIKFWVIILLPVIILVTSRLDQLNLINTDTDESLFYFYVLQSLNSTAGGILFGIAFWYVARTLKSSSPIRNFMIIAAFGFVLTFTTNQASIDVASYPPFGISSLSFLPIASYLIFFGLYSSAISLSQDMQLRQSIRNIAANDVNLLSSIGTAQMDQQVRRVVKGMKDTIEKEETELAEKTGIETPIPQEDMESYMNQVMEEVARARKPKS